MLKIYGKLFVPLLSPVFRNTANTVEGFNSGNDEMLAISPLPPVFAPKIDG
jgi:hypothetical protein